MLLTTPKANTRKHNRNRHIKKPQREFHRENKSKPISDLHISVFPCSSKQPQPNPPILIVIQRILNMQQKKLKRPVREWKGTLGSNLGERMSSIGTNRSHDTRSKLHSSRDSQLREFKKTKAKLNTLSSIGNLGIEQQIKKEIAQAGDVLRECEKKMKERMKERSEKQQLIQLQEVIKQKDEDIKALASEIEHLKKSDKNIPEEESQPSTHRNTPDNSDKEKMFKLAEEMRAEREELARCMADHVEKLANYLKIKKLIQEIQQKYSRPHKEDNRIIISYEEFKERAKTKKEEPKIKKIDFYHHLSPEKQANPSKNMKDLITRKNITLAALKNSRKKHSVQMNQLLAKIQFLKDEDQLLNQKIQEKKQQLATMQKKFSERKGETHRIQRNAILHFNS